MSISPVRCSAVVVVRSKAPVLDLILSTLSPLYKYSTLFGQKVGWVLLTYSRLSFGSEWVGEQGGLRLLFTASEDDQHKIKEGYYLTVSGGGPFYWRRPWAGMIMIDAGRLDLKRGRTGMFCASQIGSCGECDIH